ncbi:MAG: DNA ligase-associated DEXH box helicase, partial [Bacteroidota bacterium]
FEGRWLVRTTQALRAHRLSIGTIVGDADMQVQYLRGQKLGTVQESFISRLEPGDAFYLAGKTLQLVRVRDMKAYVRRAPANTDLAAIPRFTGSRLPLSTGLSDYVRRQLDRVRRDPFDSPEGEALDPIFALQRRWSTIPASGEVLIERIQTREGHHLFVYPFAGRLVHEGMAAVLALRMSRLVPITFVLSFNDYGFALLSREPAPLGEALDNGLFETEMLAQDLQAALNETEMAKRQFREVARIAGLVGAGLPGRGKSVRQLQMSASLVYDVLTRYDPGNLLLRQARREALERQLERSRLHAALERLAASDLVIETPPRLTPLAFPLWAERMQEKVSSEKLADRIRRQVLRLERAART